jgi:hypothetical protein
MELLSLDSTNLYVLANTRRQLLYARLSSIGDFTSSHGYRLLVPECQATKSRWSDRSLPLFTIIKADRFTSSAATYHECVLKIHGWRRHGRNVKSVESQLPGEAILVKSN